ncbi:trypsin-like serine peptidase [Streptomyces sp. NPDC004838]
MRPIRPLLTVTGIVAALALTATACGRSEDNAIGSPGLSSPAVDRGGRELPGGSADKGEGRGIDPDDWRDGGWKDWDTDKWLREAKDFINPVIEGLWKPERMASAKVPDQPLTTQDISGDQDVTDPEPRPVQAQEEQRPYHQNAATVGKVFFDTPKGTMVRSGTIVKDPRNPGRSNLVWTAGHCVHAGRSGGWYRNIAFVPAYNDNGRSPRALASAGPEEVAPYGTFWADWVMTSGEWIGQGGPSGGAGAPYDYAVMHVKPKAGSKSLEETVGVALDIDFNAPPAQSISAMGAWGYPAAPPYNGAIMHKCIDRPSRLSAAAGTPTMWRIGCTMTGGASGGGWLADRNGTPVLVSNTSIGPVEAGWLAGPRLGAGAQQIFTMISEKFAQ